MCHPRAGVFNNNTTYKKFFMNSCPCGTGKSYNDCCGLFITGIEHAKTPEQLMRSRYTAYTQANVDYIAQTMKKPAANHFDREAAYQWAKAVQWEKCEVLKSSLKQSRGFVEFRVYYSEQGMQRIMHEKSEFHQENGKWYYIDGKSYNKEPARPKVTRNDLCPCGSGKKYKKCCL